MTVAEAFDEFRSRLELNKSFQDAVTTHHNAVRKWLESQDPKIKTSLIGSLQRKTRIQPRSDEDIFDVDILVVLGSFGQWVPQGGVTPINALDAVEKLVENNEVYERMGTETDSPAISIEYADNIKVELVPAYLDNIGHTASGISTLPSGRGYWIPKNNQWVIADYDFDAEYISKLNEQTDGYLIPTIKLLKAAKRHSFSEMRSYHLEVLAASTIPRAMQFFKTQGISISFPLLIASFFTMAKDEILSGSNIPSSKSPSADAYLPMEMRKALSKRFGVYAPALHQALSVSDVTAIKVWGQLFGDEFPSTSSTEGALWTALRSRA